MSTNPVLPTADVERPKLGGRYENAGGEKGP